MLLDVASLYFGKCQKEDATAESCDEADTHMLGQSNAEMGLKHIQHEESEN
jgi:hypothetical protein